MKKNILLIIIIFTFLTNLIYAYNSKDAEGFWLMPAKPKGRMEVVKIIVINNNLYAYAVKLHDDVKNDLDIHNPNKSLRDKKLIGLIFIYDILFENGKWQTGKIYHTDQGSTFYANISLSEDKNTLFLKASLDKSGVVGATVKWTRLPNKYNDVPRNQLRTIDGKSL